MSDLRINVSDLIDQYREDHDYEDGYASCWPTLWRAEVDGVSWLTDRHWLLPESACALRDGIEVKALPDEIVEKVAGWLGATPSDEPYERVFAPCFAGVLTFAGLRPVTLAGYPDIAGLVTEASEKIVGCLMPLMSATPESVPLPVPATTVAMFERIHATGVVRYWQAWTLAAHLTAETAP